MYRKKPDYESPAIEILESIAETIICQSPLSSAGTEEFGAEQTPSWF